MVALCSGYFSHMRAGEPLSTFQLSLLKCQKIVSARCHKNNSVQQVWYHYVPVILHTCMLGGLEHIPVIPAKMLENCISALSQNQQCLATCQHQHSVIRRICRYPTSACLQTYCSFEINKDLQITCHNRFTHELKCILSILQRVH